MPGCNSIIAASVDTAKLWVTDVNLSRSLFAGAGTRSARWKAAASLTIPHANAARVGIAASVAVERPPEPYRRTDMASHQA